VSLSDGAKTALWLNALANGRNSTPVPIKNSSGDEVPPNPVKMYCDNQSAIFLVKNPIHPQRSKHIDMSYHFVRQLQENNKIAVEFFSSKDLLADIFTKALPAPRFQELRERIGVGPYEKN
jgi:hypothetical protein